MLRLGALAPGVAISDTGRAAASTAAALIVGTTPDPNLGVLFRAGQPVPDAGAKSLSRQIRRIAPGFASNVGHPATVLSGPHPELESQPNAPPQPFSNGHLEAAFTFMSAEDPRTGFLFSGWCQTALPHRKLPDDKVWTLATDYVRLMIEPGSIHKHGSDNETVRVGVPYGSRARLILLFLQSEAIRANSRQIQLGRSLRVWLGKLNVPSVAKA